MMRVKTEGTVWYTGPSQATLVASRLLVDRGTPKNQVKGLDYLTSIVKKKKEEKENDAQAGAGCTGHKSKSMLAERERPIALPPNGQRCDPHERGDDQASYSVHIVRPLPARVHLNQATDADDDRT